MFAALLTAQTFNQNVTFNKAVTFKGKTTVKDTSQYIVSGNDTIRITCVNDTARYYSKANAVQHYHNGGFFASVTADLTFLKQSTTNTLPFVLIGNATSFTGSDSSFIAYGDTATIGSYLVLDGFVEYLSQDSAFIYASNVSDGVIAYCSDCTGNGITGRFLMKIGAAWRRLLFD